MRQLGWLAVGVVLGAALGGIPSKRDGTELEQRLADLEAELAKRDQEPRGGGGFLPFSFGRSGPRPPTPAVPDAPPPNNPKDTGKAPDDAPPPVPDPEIRPDDPAAMAQEFDLAVDAQRLRIAQNRQALLEEADLDDEAVAELDTIFQDLNQDLVVFSDIIVDMALNQEDISSAEMLSISHDLTGVLYDSQMAMDELLGSAAPPDDDARQIWNYIDLETFRPAVEELGNEGIDGREP